MKSLSLSKPHLIIMVGVPGSGKSFFAEKFADTFHAPYVSHQKLASYTTTPDGATAIMHDQLGELLKTKQSIILEGESDTRTDRIQLSKLARDAGYEPLFIWVQTDAITAKDRSVRITKNKTSRDLTPEEFDRLAKRFTAPNEAEKPIVISGKHTYASQAKVVLKKLSTPRAQISSQEIAPPRPTTPSEPGRRSIAIR